MNIFKSFIIIPVICLVFFIYILASSIYEMEQKDNCRDLANDIESILKYKTSISRIYRNNKCYLLVNDKWLTEDQVNAVINSHLK